MENMGDGEKDALKSYFEQIKKTTLLDFDEEKLLSRKIQTGDKEAHRMMVEANLRLVVKIAKTFLTSDVSLMDLIQEGNLGLIKAADKYDYRKNVRFSTYASWWIKQSIVRSLSNKRRAIRLPHRIYPTPRFLSTEKRRKTRVHYRRFSKTIPTIPIGS
jgi:RNA polymerase primary sigma factor